MGLVSGTYLTFDAKGLRESLSDNIFDISPEDTPFTSSIGRGSAKQNLEEWQTDELAAVDTANAQLQGDDASFTTPDATVRVGNYCQILRKTAIVADSLESVDKAGRKGEMAYQILKRGKEIKRDLEAICLENQAGAAGSAGAARKMATMGAWLKSNVNFYTTDGGNPTYTSGVPGATRTDGGTLRAFTETILKDVVQQVYESGGNARVLMVGPFNKGVVSGFSGIATRNFDLSNVKAQPTAIIGAADVYVSNFGTLRVIPNRFQRERDAWVLDWNLLGLKFLRPFHAKDLAKSGDASKKLVIGEVTLQVKQEAGLGLAADLTTA